MVWMNIQQTKHTQGVYLLLGAAFTWASLAVTIPLMTSYADAPFISGLRGLGTALTLLLCLQGKKGIAEWLPSGREFLAGVLYFFTASTLVLSLRFDRSASGFVLQYCAPVVIILFSRLLLKRRPVSAELWAAVLGGAGVIIFFASSQRDGVQFLTLCMGLLSGLFWGLCILSQEQLSESSRLRAMLLGNILLSLGLWQSSGEFIPRSISVAGLIFLIAFVGSALPQILFCKGLGKLRSTSASLILSAEPIFALVMCQLFFGFQSSVMTWVGAAAILTAAVIAAKS